MMTVDDKEDFRRIWRLLEKANSAFKELKLAEGLQFLRLAIVRCQQFAVAVKLNSVDKE